MARYRLTVDSPAVQFDLLGTDFADDKGNPAGAQDIDLEVSSSNPALDVAIGPGALTADSKSITAPVTITSKAITTDFATASYTARNRVTGAVVAGDSDDFIIGPGPASIGRLDSPVPLTEIP